MKITADTNVLLRAYVADDAKQASAAVELLATADIVAVAYNPFVNSRGSWRANTRLPAKTFPPRSVPC